MSGKEKDTARPDAPKEDDAHKKKPVNKSGENDRSNLQGMLKLYMRDLPGHEGD
ncbi:MAG: hypothetical protein E3K37_01625 [Candidatus Kuenenia sp.]|nr:hypothetical protein [Candidatus Kuenenia hertensis]